MPALHPRRFAPLIAVVLVACASPSTTQTSDVAAEITEVAETNGVDQPCRIDQECKAATDCEVGVCGPDKICISKVVEGSCLIGSACFLKGVEDPTDACRECNPEVDPTGFTVKEGKDGYLSVTVKNGDAVTRACPNPCEGYCSDMATNCTGAQQQYAEGDVVDAVVDAELRVECLAYCEANWLRKLEDGVGAEVGSEARAGAAISCRREFAIGAAKGSSDALLLCPRAGASGGNLCGTWCDNYCHLAAMNCESLFPTFDACQEQCKLLSTAGHAGDPFGDSVQCRIYYAGLAGIENGSANCKEASPGATSNCQNATDVAGSSCFNPIRIDRMPFFAEQSTKGNRSAYKTACKVGGDAEETSPSGGTPDHTWEIETNANVTYTIEVTPAFEANIVILKGTCGDLKCFTESVLAPANESTQVSFDSLDGVNYFILIDGVLPAAGNAALAGGAYSMSITAGPTCADYCSKVTTICNSEHTRQYGLTPSEEPDAAMLECLRFCKNEAKLPAGSTSDSHGDTVGCRLHYTLQAAELLAGASDCAASETERIGRTAQIVDFCRSAGKTGGAACGTPCDNFCHLAVARCGTALFTTVNDCAKNCNNAPDGLPGDLSGDSTACRLSALALAPVALKAPEGEDPPSNAVQLAAACEAAKSKSEACKGDCVANCTDRECGSNACGGSCGTCTAGLRCSAVGKCVPDCDRYCQEVSCNCPGSSGFTSSAECLTVCAENSSKAASAQAASEQMQCLTWHAANADKLTEAELKTLSCGFAGKDGWDACATWCGSYCQVAQTTCGDQPIFVAPETCESACGDYPHDKAALATGFPDSNGDSIECRMKYLILAKETPALTCPAGGPGGANKEGKKLCVGP